jgi:signal transduction histidine kinase
VTIVSLPEEALYINADGGALYRIMDNLFNNICKYSLEGTRVYMDMYADDAEKVVISLKNISAEILNVNAMDLSERFVRGDESRQTEGSGLGLSIAKSMAEAMGGELKIDLDGDLFKVTLRFEPTE